MNCDDFPFALESGDPALALEAQRHAAVCPNCAATYAVLLEVKAALAAHEPVSAQARSTWESAARHSSTEPVRRPSWLSPVTRWFASAAACFVVLILVISRQGKEAAPVAIDLRPGPTVIRDLDSQAEFVELASALDTLDNQLVALLERADRLEVGREIASTLNQFNRW
jgi:hypothetical protein